MESWPSFTGDSFISDVNHVTGSSMEEIIAKLGKNQDIDRICTDNHLNKALVRDVLYNFMRGTNHTETAQNLKVHRITVQRYVATLKKLNQDDFNVLCEYALNGREVAYDE
jgi:response regulator of citrate/malate metabolism